MGVENVKTRISSLLKQDKVRNIILVIGLCGIVLIGLSSLFTSKNISKKEEIDMTDSLMPAEEYEEKLEQKLCSIVTAITGEEAPTVMLTLESSSRYVYAADEAENQQETQTYGENGLQEGQRHTDKESKYIILKDSDGTQRALQVTEIKPEIKGVVIVSKKANDVTVQEKLIGAVKTALNVSSSKVCVVSSIE